MLYINDETCSIKPDLSNMRIMHSELKQAQKAGYVWTLADGNRPGEISLLESKDMSIDAAMREEGQCPCWMTVARMLELVERDLECMGAKEFDLSYQHSYKKYVRKAPSGLLPGLRLQ